MNARTITFATIGLLAFGLCYVQISQVEDSARSELTELQANTNPEPTTNTAVEINWMSWEEALAANKANPRKLVIDVYTDWCGWCKRMDATTFKDPKVAAYIADNFYAVKLDAEQKEDILYDGQTFTYQRQGKRGVHMLAASLLDNRLSYPSVVYLNGDMERIMISPGYKDADKFLQELKYANGESEQP